MAILKLIAFKKGKLFANGHLIGLDEDSGVIKRVQ